MELIQNSSVKFIKEKNYYYNHPEKGPAEEYPLLYSLVGNASNPKARHRSDQPIALQTGPRSTTCSPFSRSLFSEIWMGLKQIY